MKIYISGPMTGLPKLNYPAFFAAERKLKEAGYEVENPARNTNQSSWEGYMRVAIKQLCDCDAVVVLPGWGHSKGACTEVKLASDLNMKIDSVDSFILVRP
jgi:hypothetical protein